MYFMLHIGKTGGTYTKQLFADIPAARDLVRFLHHDHSLETALKEFPDEQAVFAIRDPLEIFVSGFYSRMRKGQPRYNYPWTQEETIIFSTFKTPSALGEALSSEQADRKQLAEFSMRNLQHVAQCLHFYLRSVELVRESKPRIHSVLRQECLDQDIRNFLAKNGICVSSLPTYDEVVRHSNPAELDRTLSPAAIRNLRQWYRADLELYRECQAIAAELNRPQMATAARH